MSPLVPKTSILVLGPGLLEVSEDGERYQLRESDCKAALEAVRRNRDSYANDQAWARRLEHYTTLLDIIHATQEVMNDAQ
jgi:hypothetical protein